MSSEVNSVNGPFAVEDISHLQKKFVVARNLCMFMKFVFVDDVVKHRLNPCPVYRVKRIVTERTYEAKIIKIVIQAPNFSEAELENDSLDCPVCILNID